MTANLRVGFRKRQQKKVVWNSWGYHSSNQEGENECWEGLASKSVVTPTTIAPLFMLVIKQSNVETIPFHFIGEHVVIPSGSIPNLQPHPTTTIDVPSQEELDELLKRFPTFTDMEPLVTNMNDLFLAT